MTSEPDQVLVQKGNRRKAYGREQAHKGPYRICPSAESVEEELIARFVGRGQIGIAQEDGSVEPIAERSVLESMKPRHVGAGVVPPLLHEPSLCPRKNRSVEVVHVRPLM